MRLCFRLFLVMVLGGSLLCMVPLCAAHAAETAHPAAPNPQQTGAIVVGDRVLFSLKAGVSGFSPQERANVINVRIERVLSDPELRPEELEIQIPPDGEGDPVVALPNLVLINITPSDAEAEERTQERLAERWGLLLRDALLKTKPLYRPNHHEEISFLPLLLVSALAFSVPLITSRFKRFPVPIVVGEILLGIMIGRSGLGLVHYDSWLQFLAEFGFAYLMFLSGLEVDIDLLNRRTPRAANSVNGNGGENSEHEITLPANPLGVAF